MYVCVLDLEMNQPSGKIIEIGAVSINLKTGHVDSVFRALVNPGETISPTIQQLTGISDKDVEDAPQIGEAIQRFWEWVADRNLGKSLLAWGDDVDWLARESVSARVSVPEKIKTLNVKTMFAILRNAFSNRKSQGGLKSSMDTFGLKWSPGFTDTLGTFWETSKPHRAVADAWNTARLICLVVSQLRDFHAIVENTSKYGLKNINVDY